MLDDLSVIFRDVSYIARPWAAITLVRIDQPFGCDYASFASQTSGSPLLLVMEDSFSLQTVEAQMSSWADCTGIHLGTQWCYSLTKDVKAGWGLNFRPFG